MVLQEDWIGKCSLACVVTVNDYALLIRLKLVVQLADKTDYRRRIHGSDDDSTRHAGASRTHAFFKKGG